jgi:hypothetical protein
MSNLRQRKIWIVLSIAAIIFIGFFREFLFTHINEQLFALWYDEPSRASDAIPFLKSVDYYTLYYSKWILTALFSVLFFGLTIGVLKVIFDKHFWKETALIYGVLVACSIIVMGYGYFTNTLEESYLLARLFMGVAQSPLLLMVMIPGIWLRKRTT